MRYPFEIKLLVQLSPYILDRYQKLEFNGYVPLIVVSEGGYEGGGEEVGRVIGLFPIIRTTGTGYVVDATKAGFVQIDGYYASYDGTTYDDVSDWGVVTPKYNTIVVYD